MTLKELRCLNIVTCQYVITQSEIKLQPVERKEVVLCLMNGLYPQQLILL
jgi:hypothetical protein